jgi:7-cyano-7-deazaguanine synthase in queuosine biosynthesis
VPIVKVPIRNIVLASMGWTMAEVPDMGELSMTRSADDGSAGGGWGADA